MNFNNEENDKLFRQYEVGNLQLRNKIIEKNINLVPFIVNKFVNTLDFCYVDIEDLYSVGYIGLVKCIDSFDISKGIKFSTYASKYIITEVRHELRKYKIIDSLNDLANDRMELIDLIPSDDDIVSEYEDKERIVELYSALKKLNSKQKKVMMLFYGLGCNCYNQYEIAKILGCGQATVSRSLKEGRQKIYKYFQVRDSI